MLVLRLKCNQCGETLYSRAGEKKVQVKLKFLSDLYQTCGNCGWLGSDIHVSEEEDIAETEEQPTK